MIRTTIYIPRDMKSAIEAQAAREGVTEAEVIRHAVGIHLDQIGAPTPLMPLFPKGFGTDIVSLSIDRVPR